MFNDSPLFRGGRRRPAPSHRTDAAAGVAAVRDMAAHLRIFLNNCHDLVILTTVDGSPIYANAAWQRRFGDPMTVTDPFTRVHPEDAQRVDAAWQDMLDGKGEITDLQYRIQTPAGSVQVFESTAREIHDGGERLFYVLTHEATRRVQAESALKSSEARNQEILDAMNDGLIVIDDAGVILQVNPAACRIYGYDTREMPGMRVAQLVPPRDRSHLARFFRETAKGRHYRVAATNLRKDGTPVDVEVSGSMIRRDDRDCHLAIVRDITAAKRSAEAYAEKVSLLALGADIGKALTQPGPIEMVLQQCANLMVAHLNAAFARIWVITDTEQALELKASAGLYTRLDGAHARLPLNDYPFKIGVIAREKRAVFTNDVQGDPHIEDREWARREGIKAFAGQPLVVDDKVVGVIGVFFYASVAKETVSALASLADGIALGVFRSRAQNALAESEEKYRRIFDNASDAIFIAQGDAIKFPNKAALAMIGYSAEEFRAKPMAELIHPDDREDVLRRHRQRMAGKRPPAPQPYRVISKSGQTIWVEPKGVNIQWEGQPASLNFLRDITTRMSIEERLERSQRLEAIGTLAGGIAHDFNNILSAIIGYTEIAMMDVTDGSPTKRHLDKVIQAGERARNLVQQILAFSRQRESAPKPIQIRLIVSEALKLLRATVPTTISIHKQLKSDAAVNADPTQIHQVVMNLCTNAAQAMRKTGGKLSVTLHDVDPRRGDTFPQPMPTEGRYLRLRIQDTGPGIPAANLGRIFDPFFTTKAPGEGTGLGLSVVHGIVDAHNGVVTVDSAPGRGTAFEIYLPAIDAGAPQTSAAATPLPTGVEHVMVVDDEQFQVDLGQQLLERLGYRVSAFTDSRRALRRFNAAPGDVDLVITDMTMPHVTGELLARRMLTIRPDLPVIICTGYSDIIDAEKAAALGVRGFIMKPVIMKDFAEMVRTALDTPAD